MIIEVRNANTTVAGVDDKPSDGSHCVRKAIVSGEVVHVSVYSTVYKTVYRKLIEPRPHADELPSDGVAIDAERASNAPHFRLVG